MLTIPTWSSRGLQDHVLGKGVQKTVAFVLRQSIVCQLLYHADLTLVDDLHLQE